MNVRWGLSWLVGVVLLGLVAGLAGGAAAQGVGWRIVHGSDGTVYLLKDGARYAIVGDEIGADELAAYTEGDPIGSDMLLSALGPSAQAPAAQVVIQPAAATSVGAGVAEAPAEAQAVPPVGEAAPVIAAAPVGTDPSAGAPVGTDPNAAAQTAPSRAAPAGKGKAAAGGPTPAQTSSDVQFLSVQGNTPGQPVSVTVQAREGATCSIVYVTPTRARSTAAGLGPQTVGASRTVTWSFVLDAAIKSGDGSVVVTCDQVSISRTITIGGLSK